jgi:hypothetical protein
VIGSRVRPLFHQERDATAGHAFVQNLRRGHYRLTAALPITNRLAAAFDELSHAV